ELGSFITTDFNLGLTRALAVGGASTGREGPPTQVTLLTDGLHGDGPVFDRRAEKWLRLRNARIEVEIRAMIERWNHWRPGSGSRWPANWSLHTIRLGEHDETWERELSQEPLLEMAGNTGGHFTAVKRANDLVQAFTRIGSRVKGFS